MSTVDICLLIAALLCLAAVILLYVRRQRQQKRLTQLTAQIEHFLLYPDAPAAETLDEGAWANLANQIAGLEQLMLYEREQSRRQEQQTIQFAENMVHQLKNSLTALQLQLDLLEMRADSGISPTLQKCQCCMQRLNDETDRILKSSQLAAGKVKMVFEPINLQEELALTAECLRELAKTKGVTIDLIGKETLPHSGDAFWLAQAFENIVKNAVEHAPTGSTVTIRLEQVARGVEILISDCGEGIPQAELSSLFMRFHRGSTAKAGYGIGLSMAKDIVIAHHGRITAVNGRHGGAQFKIFLPALQDTRPYETGNG